MRETNKQPFKTVLFFILQKTIGKIPSEVSHCKNKVHLGWGKQGTFTIEHPGGCFLCFRDAISRLRMFLNFRESKDLSQSCWELGLWKQSTTICVKTETGIVWFDARRLKSDNTKVNVKKGLSPNGFFFTPQNSVYFFLHILRDILGHAMIFTALCYRDWKPLKQTNACLCYILPETLGVVSYNSSYEDSEDSTVNTGLSQPDIMTSWEM